MEPISHPSTSASEATADGEHDYQYIEAAYDLPIPFCRTEHGRSGSGPGEVFASKVCAYVCVCDCVCMCVCRCVCMHACACLCVCVSIATSV